MHFSALVAAASAFAGLAAAQSSTASSSIAYSTVDPSSVDSSTRNSWCLAQKQSCVTLCCSDYAANECSIDDLSYNCTCNTDSNVGSLNISSFTETLPSLECEYAVAQCTEDNPNDATAQAECQSISCGKANVSCQASASSSSAASSTTATSTASGSSSASATAATTTAAGGAQALNYGMNYGSATLVGGLVALFGFAL